MPDSKRDCLFLSIPNLEYNEKPMGFLKEQIKRLDPSWQSTLLPECDKPFVKNLELFLTQEIASETPIYPPQENFLAALEATPLHKVKAVIVGQDPYHGKNQAHGLAFSVSEGVPLPPSLKNIFKERETDLGIKRPKNGSLLSWAKQGTLLLNATLSVREGEPKSHFDQGWELLTDRILMTINALASPVVFILWGKIAQDKASQIQNSPHKLILTTPHPSPFSASSGFFGSRPFSKTNEFLQRAGKDPIDWS